MHSVSSLEAFPTKTGVLSVRHATRGVLFHSAVDPISEARTIAAQLLIGGGKRAVIIGCGLGYLERELSLHGVDVTALEVHPEMFRLRNEIQHALLADSFASPAFCNSAETVRSYLRTSGRRAVYVAPYVLALADELPREIAAEILAARVMDASQTLYRPLIEANEQQNARLVSRLPMVSMRGRKSDKIAIAVGAAPSLNRCVHAIRDARSDALIVAASGAVPILDDHGITPDWTIALEARESLCKDLDRLADGAKVVAFPWTNSKALHESHAQIFMADDSARLATGGGSSGLTAADFAFKITRGNVYIVGVDLTNANGEYAAGAERVVSEATTPTPKFAIMREAYAEWGKDHREHRVFHVITPGVAPISGLRAVTPTLFAADLRDASRNKLTQQTYDYAGHK